MGATTARKTVETGAHGYGTDGDARTGMNQSIALSGPGGGCRFVASQCISRLLFFYDCRLSFIVPIHSTG